MSAPLTPREVNDLQFAVRADRMAHSESARLEATVEKILAQRIDPLETRHDDAQLKIRRLRRKLRECREA